MSLSEGEQFAGYTIVRLLGSGEMGAVYLARHPRLPRFEALKILRAELSADPDFKRRFNQEADQASGCGTPTSWECMTGANSRAGSGSPWTTSTARI